MTYQNSFYVVGGTVPPESPSYIERQADYEVFDRLSGGEFCYVLTSRQMGKSSLMARAARRLHTEKRAAVAIVDLNQIGSERGEAAAAKWYYSLVRRIQRHLEIRCNLQAWWQQRESLTGVQRLFEFFSDLVLVRLKEQVVIFIDEIDTTIHLPFAGDFFAAIRACYNERATDPRFCRLAFVLLGVASPSQLISDAQRTPFNIGCRIDLDDFTLNEAQPLAQALHGNENTREQQLHRVLYWTNGHPYLTQKTLSKLAEVNSNELTEVAVDNVVSELFITPPIHQAEQHIADVRQFLTSQIEIIGELKATYRFARSAGGVDDDRLSPAKTVLKLSGLLKANKEGLLVVRNRIYERTFVDWETGGAVRKIDSEIDPTSRKSVVEGAVHYTTAKIVLVGDHSVGKSALGHRLIYGVFKEQASTHGQQFWVFPALGKRRKDGTECEAILWDFAGQPDYRLVHALFVDNADLALVLFDASDIHDPLHGVNFWLQQLRTGKSRCPIILVAAQTDRGTSPLTPEELSAFCRRHGIVGPIETSAVTGFGVDELTERMKALIAWEDKPATVTTTTFKRIKDYLLNLKETESQHQTIVTFDALRERLEAMDSQWHFTDDEMVTAVGHLENYGYVKTLRTSEGEMRILLEPERLNNLASSFVLEARRNPKGLGALEEKRLLAGGYDFPELRDLDHSERDVLLDSAALLFLEHKVCFRETDPLRMESYLVFPELINLKKPLEKDAASEESVSYTVSGSTENVFASLVVMLGYTHTFTRTAQWQNNARYQVGEGLVCGFRQEAERDGEVDFVLCFGTNVGSSVRTLFQGLFESFLAQENLTVERFEPVRCSNNHLLNRLVVRDAMKQGDQTTFCSACGDKVILPVASEPIQLSREERDQVETQRRAAEQRTRFEQAVFRLNVYITEQKIVPPTCFISYAWGVPEHERWVQKRLGLDLQKAGISVLLDSWYNAQIGASVTRFVERIAECDKIIMVGTPLYRQKFESKDTTTGNVVAAEVDAISQRLFGSDLEKQSVVPLLLDGELTISLPPFMHGRVYADFRDESTYHTTAFDLILNLFDLPPNHPAVADLRESLQPPGIRPSKLIL